MKELILILAVTVIAISSPAQTNNKPRFQQVGIHAGMTKSEVMSVLANRTGNTRFELGRCTSPGGDHKYLCRYSDNDGDSMAVFFSQQQDRVIGFAFTIHHEDPLPRAWKLWYEDIVEQLGAPARQTNHPDEYTIKHSEWVITDANGKKLEKVTLDAITNQMLFIDYDTAPVK